MQERPRQEHEWLHRLAGEWTYDMEAEMGPGQPTERQSGTTRLRVLDGGLWLTGEMHGTNRDGTPTMSLMTLGFDPARGRYVGSFVAPTVPSLWIYEGALDGDGRMLALEAEGPSFTDPGKRGRYRDCIERAGDDEFLFTSSVLGDDGEWREFMTMRHRRAR